MAYPNPKGNNYGYKNQTGGIVRKDELKVPPCPEFSLCDENKIVNRDLYTKTAKAIAESLKEISQTRLRRFFDEVKTISRRPRFKEEYKKNEASIMLLESKIAYMIGRSTIKAEKDSLNNLKKFFEIGLKQVHDADSFIVFVTLFEAVYGFFYEINKRK